MTTWYDDWCFYCTTKHGDADGLRVHVLEEHPDSIRAQRYRTSNS